MAVESQLFQHLNFLIVVTEARKLEEAKKTAHLLRSHACNRCEIYQDYVEDDLAWQNDPKQLFVKTYGAEEMINLIISESCDFPFYHIAAFDYMIPVVTPEWVSTCLSTNRHHRTAVFSPDRRHIFKDYQIYVSRHCFKHSEYLFYTEIVNAMGGTCIDFLSNRTTHLITKDSGDPAVAAVVGFGKVDSIKFVFPTWLVQSFKELAPASTEEHALDPKAPLEVLMERSQDLWGIVDDLKFKKRSSIFEGHNFIIGLDVSLGKDLYATLIELLQANGGTVIRHVDEEDIKSGAADCYIGSSVMSKEYETASEINLELGNLIWIFFMCTLERFQSAGSKVIFSPFKKKLFETNELILSYSNYYGRQRFYIQRLAELLGGYSTAELSRKNSHLVSQFSWGKKFETGLRWDNCTVVNHLWLEETYRSGIKRDPQEALFQEYPVRGGLYGALGQMSAEKVLSPVVQEGDAGNPEIATEGLITSFLDAGRLEREKDTPAVDLSMDRQRESSEQVFEEINVLNQAPTPDLELDIRGDTPIIELPDVSLDHSIAEPGKDASIKEVVGSPHDLNPMEQAKDEPINQHESKVSEAPAPEPLPLKEVTLESNETRDQELTTEKVRQQISNGDVDSQVDKPQMQVKSMNAAKGREHNEIIEAHSNSAEPLSLTPQPVNISQEHDHITPVTHKTGSSRSQTPLLSLTPSQTLSSSGGNRRAAKAKAAQKLHDDIEMLNEYQRSSKRKKTGSLLPQEIAQLERRKLLEQEAKRILESLFREESSSQADESVAFGRKKQLYHIEAVCTGSHETIKDLDKVLLGLLGIKIHEDITTSNLKKLNTVIAPKMMRTSKFLKSFSFHPLKYALRPDFLTDLLSLIHSGQVTTRQDMLLDLSNYTISEVNMELLSEKTSLPKKIFERAGIHKVNLVSDVTGGVEVISSILKAHGVDEVKVVSATQMAKLDINDLAINESPEHGRKAESTDCLIIITKSSQVKHFKRIVKGKCKTAMAVEWNWCISSIFGLDVDYTDQQNVIYRQDTKPDKRGSSRSK